MHKHVTGMFVAVMVLVIGVLVGAYAFRAQGTLAGVVGNEYIATSTYAAVVPTVRVLKTGASTLGSVVITGDNTGTITFYNATTSNVSLRTGQTPTSTIMVADFPASTPEGTYTFDVNVSDGLLMVTTGAPATSTVLYR